MYLIVRCTPESWLRTREENIRMHAFYFVITSRNYEFCFMNLLHFYKFEVFCFGISSMWLKRSPMVEAKYFKHATVMPNLIAKTKRHARTESIELIQYIRIVFESYYMYTLFLDYKCYSTYVSDCIECLYWAQMTSCSQVYGRTVWWHVDAWRHARRSFSEHDVKTSMGAVSTHAVRAHERPRLQSRFSRWALSETSFVEISLIKHSVNNLLFQSMLHSVPAGVELIQTLHQLKINLKQNFSYHVYVRIRSTAALVFVLGLGGNYLAPPAGVLAASQHSAVFGEHPATPGSSIALPGSLEGAFTEALVLLKIVCVHVQVFRHLT